MNGRTSLFIVILAVVLVSLLALAALIVYQDGWTAALSGADLALLP